MSEIICKGCKELVSMYDSLDGYCCLCASEIVKRAERLETELSAVKTELEQMREDRAKAVTDSTLWKCHAEGAETETWRMRQRNAELRRLLAMASCPECDGTGVIPHGYDGQWEFQQCQFCFEREEAMKATIAPTNAKEAI